ncbi:MAG: HAD family acid phosphatase [Thermoanaerobaculia bacterium]
MSGREEATKRSRRDRSPGAAFVLLLGAVSALAGCRTTAPAASGPAAPVAPAPAAPVAVHEPELQPVADGPPYVVAEAVPQDDRLNAVLWVQTSAEYRTLAETTWSAASRALERALADPHWTAALEQTDDPAGLPPAVIVDVDETVLDNSPFEAESLLAGRTFERESWLAWITSASAPAVPGALGFARRADALGVTIFYVTNRDTGEEDGTRRNLARLGFPIRDETDTVLLRGERPGYVSDKTSRRARSRGATASSSWRATI